MYNNERPSRTFVQRTKLEDLLVVCNNVLFELTQEVIFNFVRFTKQRVFSYSTTLYKTQRECLCLLSVFIGIKTVALKFPFIR